jgi:chromosome segregation ATPase
VAADQGETPELELLRQVVDVRSRDLVDARVGLAQAVAALTGELDARRVQAESALAECSALREQLDAERAQTAAALAESVELRRQAELERAGALELNAQVEQLRRRVQRLELLRVNRYAARVRRLARRIQPRRR